MYEKDVPDIEKWLLKVSSHCGLTMTRPEVRYWRKSLAHQSSPQGRVVHMLPLYPSFPIVSPCFMKWPPLTFSWLLGHLLLQPKSSNFIIKLLLFGRLDITGRTAIVELAKQFGNRFLWIKAFKLGQPMWKCRMSTSIACMKNPTNQPVKH